MPRRRRVEKQLRTPRLEWSLDALVALSNGREDWEAYWGSEAQARAAWTYLRKDTDTADYDQLWREHMEKPDPRLDAAG